LRKADEKNHLPSVPAYVSGACDLQHQIPKEEGAMQRPVLAGPGACTANTEELWFLG